MCVYACACSCFRYSTSLSAFCGMLLLVAGYMAFSFAKSQPALVFAWVCVGIGSGSTFQVRVCVVCGPLRVCGSVRACLHVCG